MKKRVVSLVLILGMWQIQADELVLEEIPMDQDFELIEVADIPQAALPQATVDQYKYILNQLQTIDKQLTSISFWAQLRLLDYFKKRYSHHEVMKLKDQIEHVGNLIENNIEDPAVKQELGNYYVKLENTFNNNRLLEYFIDPNRVRYQAAGAIVFLQDYVKEYEKILDDIGRTKTKFESVIFWCKLKRLFIPYFVSWCIHTEGGRMLHDQFELIKAEINQLPGSAYQDHANFNQVKAHLFTTLDELEQEMRAEIDQW